MNDTESNVGFLEPPSEYLEILERGVLAGSSVILRAVDAGAQLRSWRKFDKSLVSELDLEAEGAIIAAIEGGIPCRSEERDGASLFVAPKEWWCSIDPVDGTTTCLRFLTAQGGCQVGFGPLLGLFWGGTLVAATFFNVPQRVLITAVQSKGVWATPWSGGDALPTLYERAPLRPALEALTMKDCVLLGYFGSPLEGKIVGALRHEGLIRTMYRFGGFANDCMRLAQGHEEMQFQCAVKAWDLPAALFLHEAGYAVVCDPLGSQVALPLWSVAAENPIVAAPKHLIAELLAGVRSFSGS